MLIGHQKQLAHLERLMQNDRVPHALLFSGPAHIGKVLVANMFFWRLVSNEETWASFFKDNTLARTLTAGAHPDILHIKKEEDKTKISIDQVRLLKKFVGLSRQELPYKGVIIDDAHLLSHSAYNSLLKIFEEPTGKTIILLVTDQPSVLPKTILSRAFTLRFRRIPNDVVKKELQKRSLSLKDEDLGWIAGRPGLALQYHEEENGYAAALREHFYAFLSSLSTNSIQESFKQAEQIANQDNTMVPLEAWILAAYRTAQSQEGGRNASLIRQVQQLVGLRQKLATTNVNQRLHIEETFLQMVK